MNIKQVTILFGILLITGMTQITYAESNDSQMGEITNHNMTHSENDGRISLGLPPKMKQHQLSNMRSHLEAIQKIIGLIAEGEFDNASKVAHSKLGLTDEMKKNVQHVQ